MLDLQEVNNKNQAHTHEIIEAKMNEDYKKRAQRDEQKDLKTVIEVIYNFKTTLLSLHPSVTDFAMSQLYGHGQQVNARCGCGRH